jgi:hypothetical protein
MFAITGSGGGGGSGRNRAAAAPAARPGLFRRIVNRAREIGGNIVRRLRGA